MARIIADKIVGASGQVEALIVYHTDRQPWNKIPHPVGGAPTDLVDVIAHAKQNPVVLAALGWNTPCVNPQLPAGSTHWDVIATHPETKALPGPALTAKQNQIDALPAQAKGF